MGATTHFHSSGGVVVYSLGFATAGGIKSAERINMAKQRNRNTNRWAAAIALSAGLLGGVGQSAGCSGGETEKNTESSGDSGSGGSGSDRSARTSIVGRWKVDRDASRQALMEGFSKAAESGGLSEYLQEDFGDDAGAFADSMLDRFESRGVEFKEGGTWEVRFEGEDGEGETGVWVARDGFWIMDPESPRPQRLELHGDGLHMIQQGEDVQYFYEGFKFIFEPA